MANRKTREATDEQHTTRDDESRDEVWSEGSLLEAPPAREGFRQRWVSTQILGKEVPQHTLKRFREGWTPRSTDSIPEDFPVPTFEHASYGNVIGVEGQILCEITEAKAQARERYFAKKSGRLKSFVDENLNKVQQHGDTNIHRTNDESFSHGQKRIADDD